RFSRLINTGDADNDLNLGASLFQLYGTSDFGGVSSLAQHSQTPEVTTQAIVVTDNNTMICPVQTTAVGSHNLVFGMPEGCERSTCEYYVGLSPNPSDPTYLDVYLEGNAAGWIAIGFSLNTQMENDDVLGCRVNSDNVTVVDTWNPSPRQEANVLDATQDGLCVQSTSFTNSRITCSFSRTIVVTDVGQDYNLDSSYYLLFGRRAAGTILMH
uniref:DOMON domain-containing protein n=1 Tax=Amphimedon queenslandica TaxID=400682 RepID=A0A1X7SM59_AMPQE